MRFLILFTPQQSVMTNLQYELVWLVGKMSWDLVVFGDMLQND